nr:TonB-dependent siderophore receptor [Methylocystis bryophila]
MLDTPAAVEVVPHEVIQDQQDLTILEAVQNVSGVQAQSGAFYDQYRIRGFNSGYGATYRDTLKMEGIIGAEDPAFTDRVEVVKGPASMLFGRIEPGGLINIVPKKPREEASQTAQTQVGSWGLSRSSVDLTGPVDEAKTVLYRFMAVYDRADSFTDYEHHDNGAAALFLTFLPTQNFESNVQFEHYEKKLTNAEGLGAFPVNLMSDANGKPWVIPGYNDRPTPLPRNFSVGDPVMWNEFPYVIHRTLFFYDWTYHFNDQWKITNRLHYIDDHENQDGLGNWGGFDGTWLTRKFLNNPLSRGILSTNLDLHGEFETGPLKHKILAGLDWYKYQDDWVGDYGFNLPWPALNVWSPYTSIPSPLLHYLADTSRNNTLWRSRWQDFGAYVQNDVSFLEDRVHLLLGGRYDEAPQQYSKDYGYSGADCWPNCTGYPLKTYSDRIPVSPRVGALFKMDDRTSIYGSYVRSTGSNNSSVTADGRAVPPEKAKQWEVGVKREWLEGRFLTTLALFDLTKMNVLEPDPSNPMFSIPVGKVNSRGVEFDASGQVTENLNIIGSYTFNPVKVIDDGDNGGANRRFEGAAPHVGNIWAKWDTAPKQPEGFEFGFGVYAMSWRWGDLANTWVMPGYVKFDMMGGYRTLIGGHKLTVQLNIKNLSDTRYWDHGDAYQFAFMGKPRTFIGMVKLDW